MPPHAADDNALLDRYVRTAERVIAEQPETYLWTNRRWKKQPPAAEDTAAKDGDAPAAADAAATEDTREGTAL